MPTTVLKMNNTSKANIENLILPTQIRFPPRNPESKSMIFSGLLCLATFVPHLLGEILTFQILGGFECSEIQKKIHPYCLVHPSPPLEGCKLSKFPRFNNILSLGLLDVMNAVDGKPRLSS